MLGGVGVPALPPGDNDESVPAASTSPRTVKYAMSSGRVPAVPEGQGVASSDHEPHIESSQSNSPRAISPVVFMDRLTHQVGCATWHH